MAERMAPRRDPAVDGGTGGSKHLDMDWEGIERSPEFQELITRRRRFVVPATIFFLAWYLGFILLAGYAEDFMGERIYEGITVGYVLALTQFIMVWGLAWLYLRKADREFDPLERAAAERAGDVAERTAREGRFAPTSTEVPATKPVKAPQAPAADATHTGRPGSGGTR